MAFRNTLLRVVLSPFGYLIGVFLLALIPYEYLSAPTSHSYGLVNHSCEESYVAAFYKFDKFIVLIRNEALNATTRPTNVPREFHNDAFGPRIERAIRRNFAGCLNTSQGGAKPLILIYGLQNDVFDSHNVVLIVTLQYPLSSVDDLALLQMNIFRAGLEPRDALAAWEYFGNAASMLSTHAKDNPLSRQLDNVLDKVKPDIFVGSGLSFHKELKGSE